MLYSESIAIIFAVAGVLWLLGKRRLAVRMISTALAAAICAPLLTAILPGVSPVLVMIAIIAIATLLGLAILHFLVTAGFGPNTAGHVTGTYLVRLIDSCSRSSLLVGGLLLALWLLRA